MKVQGVVEDRLVLLKGVSGAFRSCVLTALMGVSGAGKMTLIWKENWWIYQGRHQNFWVPKEARNFFFFYCEQNDIHSPQVTVYESLLYSAWLRRRPLEIDAETRKVGIYIVFHLHIKHLFFRASSKFMFLLTFFFFNSF
jgi:ABC-type multidrug transport system ATPase subunit